MLKTVEINLPAFNLICIIYWGLRRTDTVSTQIPLDQFLHVLSLEIIFGIHLKT